MDSHTSLFTFEQIKINKYSFWAGEFWSNKRFKNLLENHGGGGGGGTQQSEVQTPIK